MEENKTLKEVKEFIREHFKEGLNCPACGQNVKLYEYKLFRMSAIALIYLYKLTRDNPEKVYFHVSKYAEAIPGKKIRSPHFAELRFWGFIVAKDRKTKESNASGFWAITEKGKNFVEGRISVPERIMMFNNKWQGFAGEAIMIEDAMENSFEYQEMMGDILSIIEKSKQARLL